MKNLGILYDQLCRRLDRIEAHFTQVVAATPKMPDNERWLIAEGIVSQCWQIWSGFCRHLVVASSVGCTTRTGIVLPPVVAPAAWERVSYMALRVVGKAPINAGMTNNILRKEPTWGDVVKLSDIIKAIRPRNEATLLTAFGAVVRGPIHLQLVRNAAAHVNFETFAGLKAIRTYYVGISLRHPVDVAFWVDPSIKNYALLSWMDDMKLVADYATA